MKTFLLTLTFVMVSTILLSQVKSSISPDNTRKLITETGMFNAPPPNSIVEIGIDRDKVLKEAREEEELKLNLPYWFGKGIEVDHT